MEMKIVYKDCKRTDETNSFMTKEVWSTITDDPKKEYAPKVIEIKNIYIPKRHRRSGSGSALLSQIIGHYQNDVILAAACATKENFPKPPTEKQLKKHFEVLDKFFKKNGFESINQAIQYKLKHAYVFTKNNIGEEVKKKMLNAQKEVYDDHSAFCDDILLDTELFVETQGGENENKD